MSDSQHNDNDSFFSQMSDVRPLTPSNTIAKVAVKETLAQKLKRRALEREIESEDNGLSVIKVTPLDPHDFLSYKQDGVQEGVFKNLRLAKYQIDTNLMLTHLKFDDARNTLYETLKDCHQRGIRTVLVQHGLGLKSKPFPAFLKSYVNQWLRQMDIVIAYHSALKQHGGLGAVYVLLKKHPNQKLINRERNRKGG